MPKCDLSCVHNHVQPTTIENWSHHQRTSIVEELQGFKLKHKSKPTWVGVTRHNRLYFHIYMKFAIVFEKFMLLFSVKAYKEMKPYYEKGVGEAILCIKTPPN